MKRTLIILALVLAAAGASAQFPKDDPAEDVVRTTRFPRLKQLKMTAIPGAPVLQQPMRIDGTQQDIRTCKHGLCYPAIYDWNGDGRPDLLLGEFSTGDYENNIRVYLNEGSKKEPKFSGKYFYATDTRDSLITNSQWCCIGIHPRLVDITGDGRPDLLSGQYNPGLISLWRGTADGFLQREFIPQEGYVEGDHYNDSDPCNPESNTYWNYTSAHFADFDGDGLPDLFVGGSAGPRVALNKGTSENPRFGLRKYLYMTDGNILSVDPEHPQADGRTPKQMKTYMTPTDWDGDGVLDILLTYEYATKGSHAVLFYKGVNTNLGLRFKHPVTLFEAEDGTKALPGCQPMICVCDLNGDGVNDIVMGLSIPCIGYDVQQDIAWQWVHDLGLEMPGKDAGEYYMWTTRDSVIQRCEKEPYIKEYYLGKLNDYKYLDLRHRGYVLVFYGKKNPVKAPPAETIHIDPPKPVPTQAFEDATADEPLTYQITTEKDGVSIDICIVLSFRKGWHGYADCEATARQGMIPTAVTIEAPEGIYLSDNMSKPYAGGSNIYVGQIKFRQQLIKMDYRDDTIPLKIKISYQACDESLCLPPTEHTIDYVVK